LLPFLSSLAKDERVSSLRAFLGARMGELPGARDDGKGNSREEDHL